MSDMLVPNHIRTAVPDATVRLADLGGLGVLVHGGFIVTATHCIKWDGTGMMALGEVYPATVLCADGTTFRLGVAAADPVSDIAVLWALDNQEFPDDVARFEEWQERVVPAPLKHFILDWQQSCPAFVLSHEGNWLIGRLTRYSPPFQPMSSCLALDTDEEIKGGTSGGPVVSEDGKLLGIVSSSSSHGPSLMPVAHLTLPRWVLDQVAAATAAGGDHEQA